MTIDWITVAAQAVNFLVLVWLLQRFLYRPVVRAMDRREAGIAERIQAAEARRREADATALHYQTISAELEERRDALHEEARRSAAEERQRLLAGAAREVEEERRLWRDALATDRAEFLAELRQLAAREICLVVRTALHDLAHTDLEPQIASTFVDRLEEMDDAERRQIAEAAQSAQAPIAVKTSAELAAGPRGELQRALRSIAGDGAEVVFETDAEMAPGVVAVIGSRTITWSIDGYLRDFEARLGADLDEIAPQIQQS